MPSTSLLKRLGLRPLALRLLGWVLLYSLLLSLVATGVQMIGEFERRKSDAEVSQERAAELLGGALSTSIWILNYSDVANHLDDLLSLPTIQYARIITTSNEELSSGIYPDGPVVSQSFPLVFDRPVLDEPQPVGELTLVTSVANIHNEIYARALLNLLFQSIVVMLGTLGLLLIVRLTLSRHLETMADYAAKLNLDALVDPLKLKRKPPRKPDELSELEQALNNMRLQILEDTRSLRQTTLQTQGERDDAVRANHAKNRFLANVSHELRIPLQSVLGYANLLSDTPLDQEQREYVHTLLNASESLSAIINDLLDISSMEAGKLELEAIAFDLRETVNDLVHMLGARAREKGLALEVRIDENLPWALNGDPIRIRQVLLNLVSNAVKFTEQGEVQAFVRRLSETDEGVELQLTVRDTGLGITPDEQEKIFDAFRQADGSTARRHGGGAKHQPRPAAASVWCSSVQERKRQNLVPGIRICLFCLEKSISHPVRFSPPAG